MNDTQDNTTDRPLPVGRAEFEEFAARLITKAGAYADEDSMKFVIASTIMHADSSKDSLPDSYFLARLRKLAANQVAATICNEIKEKQLAAAVAAKQEAEATAKLTVVASEKENA